MFKGSTGILHMSSSGHTSKCERSISRLCVRVLQTACRTTKMQFKALNATRQASLLTLTRIRTRAPWMPGHIRGGQSTSDKTTASSVSKSLCPMSAATTVIITVYVLLTNVYYVKVITSMHN